jgi:phosphoribosyl 1,2-cyclic phosphodiesterase
LRQISATKGTGMIMSKIDALFLTHYHWTTPGI